MAYQVIAVPMTPLSAMEAVINSMAVQGYYLVHHFFGADGLSHVPGGVGPTKTTSVVVNPATGQPCIVQITTNQIVMVFSNTSGGGGSFTPTVVSTGTYAVLSTDTYLQVTATATTPVTINLANMGKQLTIVDSSNNAAANAITLVPPAGYKIDFEAGNFIIGNGGTPPWNVSGISISLTLNSTTSNLEIN